MIPKFLFRFVFFLGILFTFFSTTVYAEFFSVKTKNLILFEGPSTSTKKKFIVTEGYPLKVIVSLKDWKKVEDHLGKISWAQTKNLDRERTVITLKSQATIYNKPSTSEAKLAHIDKFVALDLLSPVVTDGWIKVKSVSIGLEGFIKVNEVWGI
ncbi:MAG: SH3-like domain-containing protein [Methylophilaceae bacterium]|mgnify:CR=1 FL=1|jgi:SH3-like domain-containing protein|tara:strand:+ start:744 stop:1205 length:462 start_codon:yes stop_codon:yes gene_type:complete